MVRREARTAVTGWALAAVLVVDGARVMPGRHGCRVESLRPLGERRLPHNLHVSFEGVEGERLLMSLGDLAVSTGSACSAGSQKASHVLEAIGASQSAGPSIRFGLGRETSEQEIETAAARVVKVVRSLRDSAVTA